MNLLKDLWGHLKEWNEWKLKDWIKAGILVVIILIVLNTGTGNFRSADG